MARLLRIALLLALGTTAVTTPRLAAAGAPPASDFLQTFQLGPVPANGTTIDFGPAPIPADFFGPGSQPFTGVIYFGGEPLGTSQFGYADTRVQRFGDPFDRADPPGPSVVPVPIELVELQLRSIEPIVVTISAQPTLWDVTLNLPAPPQPQGTMMARKTHPNGGTFDAVLPVQPVFTFTRVLVPHDQRTLPSPQPFDMIFFTVPWVHDVDPSLDVFVPPGANFVPGIEEVTPGNPGSQQRSPRTGQSQPQPGLPNAQHTIAAPEGIPPIPGTSGPGLAALALALAGAGGFLARARRRSAVPGAGA